MYYLPSDLPATVGRSVDGTSAIPAMTHKGLRSTPSSSFQPKADAVGRLARRTEPLAGPVRDGKERHAVYGLCGQCHARGGAALDDVEAIFLAEPQHG